MGFETWGDYSCVDFLTSERLGERGVDDVRRNSQDGTRFHNGNREKMGNIAVFWRDSGKEVLIWENARARNCVDYDGGVPGVAF